MRINRWSSRSWTCFGVALMALGVWQSSQAVRADLYGHWPLDDGDGEEARNLADDNVPGIIFDWDSLDSLGGTEEDPTVWVDDPGRGTVIGLNGQTQWVDAGFLKDVMTLENDHTWAFWGRLPPEQASPNNDIVLGSRWGSNGSDTSPREFIKFTPNRFEYHMNGGFGDDLAYADSNLPQEQWVHNSVVKDGDSLTYYRNGQQRSSTTITGGQSSGDALTIGFGGDVGSGGGEAWRGSLDDVQLYTSALTPAQIATVMGGDVVADAELFAHYPLDEGGDADIIIGTGPGAIEDGAFIENPAGGLGADGNVWVEDSERGTVLTFNGAAGSYVEAVSEAPLFDLENDFTWNFWSKSDGGQAQTSNTIIIGNRNDFSGTDNGEWIKFTNDRIEYHADGTNNSDLQWADVTDDDIRIPNDDQWYHHTVVKDGDQMSYYRDGIFKNQVSLGLGQQTTESLPFAMGGQAAPGNSGGETPIVFLSDVRLYDNALTPAEVAELAGVAPPPASLPGDADGDGDVDFDDFVALSNSFNQAVDPPGSGADFNADGTVNFDDFVVLSNNFGTSAAASVPEPSTAILLALAGMAFGLVRKRR